MDNIVILDIDSMIPNLALKKIEKYHIDKGDQVTWNNELMTYSANKIYVSCIFKENKWKCNEWKGRADIGGSGYDLKKKLPAEIEKIKPRINLGFTTRGCIRKCYFCIVPEKEGKIYAYNDIYDIWDSKSKEITLLDNNILALPDHFNLIYKQLKKENLRVDFNQGLDHRLLTDDNVGKLLSLKHIREIRFAFDDLKYKSTVLKAIEILKKHGIKDWGSRWYVYVGEKDTFDSVYERMELLRENKQSVYLMRDSKVMKNKKYIALTTWSNFAGNFKYDFYEGLDKNSRIMPYKKYFNGGRA